MSDKPQLIKEDLEAFCAITASSTPAPGGGSISALCGALAASLAEMVAHLSGSAGNIGMASIACEAEKMRLTLLDLIQKDAESFNAVMDCFALPKDTPEQKAFRKEKIQAAFKAAAEVPLSVAQEAAKTFEFLGELIEKGNQNALTDSLVAVMCARSAVLGASLNVRINLASIKDEQFNRQKLHEVQKLEALANESEKKFLSIGYLKLDGE